MENIYEATGGTFGNYLSTLSPFCSKNFWLRQPMPINLDDIQPVAAVTISIASTIPEEIKLQFARIPDADVLKDLEELARYPFIQDTINLLPDKFAIWTNKNFDSCQVAERIARSLEQEHQLTVQRLVSDPQTRDQTPRKSVASFI